MSCTIVTESFSLLGQPISFVTSIVLATSLLILCVDGYRVWGLRGAFFNPHNGGMSVQKVVRIHQTTLLIVVIAGSSTSVSLSILQREPIIGLVGTLTIALFCLDTSDQFAKRLRVMVADAQHVVAQRKA